MHFQVPRRWALSGGTLTVGSCALTIGCCTLTVDGYTLIANGYTLMSDNCTLMVNYVAAKIALAHDHLDPHQED
jgi:hypothetical protein